MSAKSTPCGASSAATEYKGPFVLRPGDQSYQSPLVEYTPVSQGAPVLPYGYVTACGASIPPSMVPVYYQPYRFVCTVQNEHGQQPMEATYRSAYRPATVNEPQPEQFTNHLRRNSSQITDKNAQDRLDPVACIFVGNLPIWLPRKRLQVCVKSIFRNWGDCYVKVNLSPSNKLYNAFVQFTNVEHARQARAFARNPGIYLAGRHLRLETPNKIRSSMCGHPATMDEMGSLDREAHSTSVEEHCGSSEHSHEYQGKGKQVERTPEQQDERGMSSLTSQLLTEQDDPNVYYDVDAVERVLFGGAGRRPVVCLGAA
ncbi:uncharacterized protein BO80DRAFT_446651 [Aspergillus ibericus CBS 121593]|uniref:RRM domain-containing protein n=1 Tax=Aspergillus ibericus CBS 121593 TaxID=1448316 RepID=A0A395GW86_9EURO|nr:hypothetical protein BO80DRAFT_446651 [Aspergillus ibericus CBS 121593]RAK99364.1 hypothetical protein BO80DRAFT_446651 [Aspergillus ibericus CBS 121593]